MKNLVSIFLALLCFNTFTVGQTQLVKYKGNPVLTLGPTGSWDSRWATDPQVAYDGTVYRMWYTGSNDGTHSAIGFAVSTNGANWTKHPGNPVLTDPAFQSAGVAMGSVLRVDSTYHMYYNPANVAYRSVVCHATSSDGIIWTRDDINNPVLGVGSAGQWDDFGVTAGAVIKQDYIWKMWYVGYRSTRLFHTGYATSADGIHWIKDTTHNPILPPGSPGSWDAMEQWVTDVLYDGSRYEMLYCGDYLSGVPSQPFGYATSTDGIVWVKHPNNPILRPGPEPWESRWFSTGSFLKRGDVYMLWYTGTSDGITGANGLAIDSPTGYVLPNPIALNFSNTAVGQQLDTLTVKIHNYGRQAASITGLSVGSSNFQIWNRPTLPYALDSSGAYDLRIIFRPQTQGTLVDSLVIITNAPSTPRNAVSLQGIGIPVSVGDTRDLPTTFSLSQNYPNPFNPSTTIRYGLPNRSHVTLTVFNTLGQQVAQLVNGDMEAGYHEVKFDGSKLASGVYLYRMQAGAYTSTRKLVLVK